jgi:arsenite/tail-anchored protein-transporting ATPase
MTRIIVLTGKGGVGKTSVAAATALRCADLGYRTVVVSTDAAHSLGDSLDITLGPELVEVVPHLRAQEIDVLYQMEKYWGDVQNYMAAILAWRGMDNILAEETSVFPGMEELASLLQIVKLYDDGDNDVIIVDAAPTGETLRLLSFPEVGRWYLEKILPLERKAISIARPFLSRVVDMPLPDEQVFVAIEQLVQQLSRMHTLLADPRQSSIRIVLNPEKMVIREAQRTFTYLNLYGYATDLIISNRLIPGGVTDVYFSSWRDSQARYGQSVKEAFAPVPILTVPLFEVEVVGPEMLRRMAHAIYGDRDPSEVFYVGRAQEIVKEGDTYRMRLPLPFVSKEQIRLTRSADELVVHIGNQKRNLILPRALVGLQVVNAKQEDDILTLVFADGRKNGSQRD